MNPLQNLLFKLSEMPPAHRVLALFAVIAAAALLVGYVQVLKQWMVYGDDLRVAQRTMSGKRMEPSLTSMAVIRQISHLQVADKAGK